MRLAWMLSLSLLWSACTTQVRVRPAELVRHSDEILSKNEAEVAGESAGEATTVRVSAATQVSIRVMEGALSYPKQLAVRELVAGCSSDGRATDCFANRINNEPLTFAKPRKNALAATATGVT